MPNREASIKRSKVLLREEHEAQVIGVGLQNYLIKSRECFMRANIHNRSKSLHGIVNL